MSSLNNTNDKGDSKPSPKTSEGRGSAKKATSSGKRRRRLKFEETINPNAEQIRNATDMDIIFGRGRGFQDHPGNKRMRAIVSRHKADYRELELSRKRGLVEAVYDEITENGTRFLYKQGDDEDTYVAVEVPVALQKVRNLLRCKKVYGKKPDMNQKLLEQSNSSEEVAQKITSTRAQSEVAIQPLSIQPPLATHITNVSAASLPLHLSSASLLAMENMHLALLAPRQGMLDPAGLQPLTRTLPSVLPIQMPSIGASNAMEQLQMLRQYQQQLRASELANLIQSQSKKPQVER